MVSVPYFPKQMSIDSILKIVTVRGKYRLGLTPGAKAMKKMIALMARGETVKVNGAWDKENWVHIRLAVHRPHVRCDAHNVLKLVCDAIQDGIGIDDSNFWVHEIQPLVDPDNPRVEIYVWQEEEVNVD